MIAKGKPLSPISFDGVLPGDEGKSSPAELRLRKRIEERNEELRMKKRDTFLIGDKEPEAEIGKS